MTGIVKSTKETVVNETNRNFFHEVGEEMWEEGGNWVYNLK